MKINKCDLKNNIILFFIILFCFGVLFGFNDEHIDSAINLKYMVIPYININMSIFLAGITIITIISIILLDKLRIDKNSLLFIIRLPLYFIPIMYIKGDFNIGTAYAIIQCLFAYLIGINYTSDKKKIIKILTVFSLIIACEVFYTLLMNGLTIFSDNIKWYMVIPLGKSNYISCFLLPLYVLVSRYFEDNKLFFIIYTIIMSIAIIGTASKLALILIIIYLCYQFFNRKLKDKIVNKKKFFISIIELIVIFVILYIFINNNIDGISTITSRFTSTNIFETRIYVYSEALNYIYSNPLFGRSAYVFHVYDTYKAHNFLLESLVETGFVGTVILCIILIKCCCNIKMLNNKKDRYTGLGFFFIFLIQGLIEPNMFVAISDTLFWIIIAVFCYNDK